MNLKLRIIYNYSQGFGVTQVNFKLQGFVRTQVTVSLQGFHRTQVNFKLQGFVRIQVTVSLQGFRGTQVTVKIANNCFNSLLFQDKVFENFYLPYTLGT